MPNTREKLINDVAQGFERCTKVVCIECDHFTKLAKCKPTMIADHLIAQGWTQQQWSSVTERPQTLADQIRSLSDEELAEKVYCLYAKLSCSFDPGLLFCDGKAGCIDEDGNIKCDAESERACILRWLRQPATEIK